MDTKRPEPFKVGETVYCLVTALRGQPYRVTDVQDGRIKILGYKLWCPASNFAREIPVRKF